MQDMSDETVRQRFGRLIADAARRTGKYDLDSTGGKARLARATGLSESAVGRMLRGETLPKPAHFEPIANAVDLPVRDLLIASEIVSAESLQTPAENSATGVASRSITPQEAADALGIVDPVAREMFYGTVDRLRRIQDADDEPTADGGTAAQM